MDAAVVIEPRKIGDGTLEQNAKFAWKSDWYIEVDLGEIVPAGGNAVSQCASSTSFSCILTALQVAIDANPGPIADELDLAVLKTQAAAAQMPDGATAIVNLLAAKVDVDAANTAGLNNGVTNQLQNDFDDLIADIYGGANGLGAANDGTLCDDGITHTRSGTLKTPSVSECKAIFAFRSEHFYEGRERRYVDIIEVNVAQLQAWGNSGSGDPTSTLYITIDTLGTEDDENDGVYPVIRLINGSSLVDPLTVSTVHPLYVQGNYNTGATWQPAALIGDAITFLSTVWSDAAHQAATVIKPDAANTTVYAAVMAGHSGTPCDHEASGCGATSPYGGGLENFPRFLERWSNKSLTFRGSLVSLSFSQQATGLWGGAHYSPPIRDWEFDMRFNDPANMPPGTPVVGNVIHTAFRPIR